MMRSKTLKCWGKQWGKDISHAIGNESGEMGTALGTVDLGGDVKQVRLGLESACALMENGDVKCWGKGIKMQGRR